jgi:hypothetical protein
VVFRALIGLFHNIAFLKVFSFAYDASIFTPPSPWGAFVILVPVIGGLIVTFLIVNFAPEARGHGVPEVMDAIYYKEGVIRPIVAVIKSLAWHFRSGPGRPSAAKVRSSRSAPRWVRRSAKLFTWRLGSVSRWSRPVPAPASPRLSTRRSAA